MIHPFIERRALREAAAREAAPKPETESKPEDEPDAIAQDDAERDPGGGRGDASDDPH